MEDMVTIGQSLDLAIARATAEMTAARAAVHSKLPMQGDLNPINETRKHLAEVIDAMLNVAGGLGGEDSKRDVLKQALSDHGFEIK